MDGIFAVLTLLLVLGVAYAVGAVVAGAWGGVGAVVVAGAALCWFLYRSYRPRLQEGIKRLWNSVALTGK